TALAFAIYIVLAQPDALRRDVPSDFDAPTESRADPLTRRADLVAHLEHDKRDGRAWVLLARLDFAADRFHDAAQEYSNAVAASTKVARDPEVWCEYADALGMAQGGSLEGQPGEFIARALAIDSKHPKALEMAGSAAYGQRDYAGAVRYWQTLLA